MSKLKMFVHYNILILIIIFLHKCKTHAQNCSKPNEEFKECGPYFPATCYSDEIYSPEVPSCRVGCFCKSGFLRNNQGNCIKEELCKCRPKFELTTDFPHDEFAGNEKAYIACIYEIPGGIKAPEVYWKWLEDKNTKTLVTVDGQWLDYECAPGNIKPFHVSSATYNQTLTKCKELGYETAQPGIPNVWSPFAIGNVTTDYYYWAGGSGAVRYEGLKLLTKCCPLSKEEGITLPSPKGKMNSSLTSSSIKNLLDSLALPEDNFSADDKTFVLCVKQTPGEYSFPDWEWLSEEDSTAPSIGRLVQIKGQWINHTCPHGNIESFRVSTLTYKTVLSKCLEKGYYAAQPAHNRFGDLYPFQVGNYLADYFSFTLMWKASRRIPPTPVTSCDDKAGAVPGNDKKSSDIAYVSCVSSAGPQKPSWAFSYWDDQRINVSGKWIQYQCPFGDVDAFKISWTDYISFFSCKEHGSDTIQPVNISVFNSLDPAKVKKMLDDYDYAWALDVYYPFEVNGVLTDHFYKAQNATPTVYIPSIPVSQCKMKSQ